MQLIFPQIKGTLVRGVACCWHIAVDEVPAGNKIDIENVAVVNHESKEVFVRAIISPSKLQSTDQPVLHAHFEMRTADSFKEKPNPDIELLELEGVIAKVIDKRDVVTADYTIDCQVPWDQIALGSILAPIIGLGDELMEDHGAMLTNGRFAITGEPADFLHFSLGNKDDEPYFNVRVEGSAGDAVSWDMFSRANNQLLPEFNRLVLSRTSDNESGNDRADA